MVRHFTFGASCGYDVLIWKSNRNAPPLTRNQSVSVWSATVHIPKLTVTPRALYSVHVVNILPEKLERDIGCRRRTGQLLTLSLTTGLHYTDTALTLVSP